MSEMDSPASRRFSVDGKPNSPLGKKLSSPMSSASQVEEGKPKYSKDELAEFRQKTIARLIDKRRADEGNKVKAIEEEKQLDKMFRSKWRETVKAKKLNAVISEVDKKILKQTIQTEPEVIARLVAREPSSSIDTSLEGLLEGLNDCDGEETVCKKTGRNSNRSSFSNNTNDYVVSKVRNSDRFFLSDKIGTTSSSATQFLRNSVTYKMTINERIRKHSIQEVGRARSDSTDLKSSLGVSGTPNHRLFSSYENEMNLISLLGKLLDDQYTVDGEENVPRKIIKTTGLMAKFIQKSRLPLQVSTNGNQDMNNLNSLCSPVHRAQSFFSNTRMHSRSSADRSLSDAGFFPEIVPAKSTNNMLTQVDDQLFCSLVEKVFLLGPSKRDIESLMFANLGDDSSNVDFPSTLDNNNDGIKVLKEKTRIVDSKILFMTEKDDFEVLSLLPSFSFPRYVLISSIFC